MSARTRCEWCGADAEAHSSICPGRPTASAPPVSERALIEAENVIDIRGGLPIDPLEWNALRDRVATALAAARLEGERAGMERILALMETRATMHSDLADKSAEDEIAAITVRECIAAIRAGSEVRK